MTFVNMNKPLVSIIMPTYNGGKLIQSALLSIQAQTYTAWEVIVVEDASKDQTEEIVQEFARLVGEHKVKYIRHSQNQGASVTRNTAMKQAQGKYLAFLDHDDLWKENHLETAVNKLESSGCDLIYSTVEMFANRTNKTLGFWGPSQQDIENFPGSLLARNYITPSVVVMRSSIPEKVGHFDPNIKGPEDLDYWLRIAAAGFKFIYIPGIYGMYRKTQSSAITSNVTKITEQHALVLRKHRNLSIIPLKIRSDTAVQYHMRVVKFNLKTNPLKATEFFLWALKISPQASLVALGKWLFHTDKEA
ncbi:glycosyltransferase family A protein [Coleofasciculus sp. FACHB-1120]|uniref:glycosyltransferase family 2 protein n=1 Tax=Coleofasciculus sp. FACHB-1120 TaxID=2692783 RepID=UPI0016862FD6|nr:glycosyltransferase family A protein [Coleofasciculus sp. FACHB-1120]MBD2740587.1 glycosyltransferase family 2 protein [Coleofasciculus sp. FACHB-1120]